VSRDALSYGAVGSLSRIRRGLARLPEAFRALHADYVRRKRNPDGGFPGRSDGSDVYYTAFAARAAEVLDIPDGSLWQGIARHLEGGDAPVDLIAAVSWLDAARLATSDGRAALSARAVARVRRAAADLLRTGRAPGGGYPAVPNGPSSVYHTFLAYLCRDLLGECADPAGKDVPFLLRCRCADGGFADREGGPAGGTNPTAAAVAVLARGGSLDAKTAGAATGFLLSMQRGDGGFAAGAGAASTDLLSTFTALLTLSDLGRLRRAKLAAAGRYVRALLDPGGGFRAGPEDGCTNIEYTFYGLGTLGLLADEASHGRPRPCVCARDSGRSRKATEGNDT